MVLKIARALWSEAPYTKPKLPKLPALTICAARLFKSACVATLSSALPVLASPPDLSPDFESPEPFEYDPTSTAC